MRNVSSRSRSRRVDERARKPWLRLWRLTRNNSPIARLQFFQNLGPDFFLESLLVSVGIFPDASQHLLMAVPLDHVAVAIFAPDEMLKRTRLICGLESSVDDLVAVLIPGKHFRRVQALIEKSLLEFVLLIGQGAGRIEVRIGRRLRRVLRRLKSALDVGNALLIKPRIFFCRCAQSSFFLA